MLFYEKKKTVKGSSETVGNKLSINRFENWVGIRIISIIYRYYLRLYWKSYSVKCLSSNQSKDRIGLLGDKKLDFRSP